jgi:hypothetical protein
MGKHLGRKVYTSAKDSSFSKTKLLPSNPLESFFQAYALGFGQLLKFAEVDTEDHSALEGRLISVDVLMSALGSTYFQANGTVIKASKIDRSA